MILRPYSAADAVPTLVVFQRAVRETAARDYTPEQIRAWAPDEASVEAWAARREAADTLVAVEVERLIGFTDVDADGYIDMMFVDPAFCRRGVATALLDAVTRTALERRTVSLTAHVSVTARPFFESRGFVVVAERAACVRGVTMTNFLMRRELAPALAP